ncbi:hypothetical protein [Cytobacillus firmus]|uniref:hypothetical protein n=1 Tax=Cytobacillus firmus TaxID=1399 RepID=UPI00222816CB|nr:hypothetical protein [Cytobacillus firmus]
MGGTETVRGILFQALVCCQEIFKKSWTLVHFEPTFKDEVIEKVDILFVDESGKKHALQVKSSINKFGKAEIVGWISDLKSDIDADYYELQLVGDLRDNAKVYVENINKSDTTIVKVNSFDINKFENDILNEARNFLKQRNVGSNDKELMSNIKIISYELLKSSLNNNDFSFKDILEMLTNKNNDDMKEFCQLIRDRLDKRIKLILQFYKNTYSLYGFGSHTSILELNKTVKKVETINTQYEMHVSDLLKNIGEDEKFYEYLCREYLKNEEQYIEDFLSDLSTSQQKFYQKNSLTFHLQLRTKINNLLKMYNNIDENISNKYFFTKNQKELFETQDDINIKYNDLNSLETELKKLVFREQQNPRVIIITENPTLNDLIHESINADNKIIINISENFNQNQMYDYIVQTNEAFTETGSFSPQLYIRYVVFVLKVSDEIKIKLEQFKTRATIKYIFVEK